MSRLIFGCGYLGQRVARQWLTDAQSVYVVTRSEPRAAEFAKQGFQPIVADICQPDSLQQLPDVDTVLFSVGFDRKSDQTIHQVYVDGLRAALDALPGSVKRFIYISSTGVYGQTDGSWVDEDSPCNPSREGGKACLAAEQLVMSHPIGNRANILRMAGLYGPGRLPSANKLASGERFVLPTRGYLNLIHIEDAAEIVLTVAADAPTPRTYVVSDGRPALRRDYYQTLASLMKIELPPFDEASENTAATQGSGSGKRSESDKRVSNQRIMTELPVKLKYPTYREGAVAILQGNNTDRTTDAG